MKIDHTPAEIRLNRTVFRFTKAEAIEALIMGLSRMGKLVPEGKSAIWHPSTLIEGDWEVSLVVDHPDPPPKAQ